MECAVVVTFEPAPGHPVFRGTLAVVDVHPENLDRDAAIVMAACLKALDPHLQPRQQV